MRAARTFRETTPQEKERARQTPGRKNHEETRNGKGEDARLPGESRSEGQGVRREPRGWGEAEPSLGKKGPDSGLLLTGSLFALKCGDAGAARLQLRAASAAAAAPDPLSCPEAEVGESHALRQRICLVATVGRQTQRVGGRGGGRERE